MRNIEIILRFFFAVLKYRPDIIFAHNLPALTLVWPIVMLRGRKTILLYDAMELESHRVLVVRSFIPFISGNFQITRMERFFAKRANIVTSADYARTEVMAKIISRPDIITCRNVPKLSEVSPLKLFHEHLTLNKDTFIFLYHGMVCIGRGLEQGIKSLEGLPKNIIFIIMGMIASENYRNELRELAKSVGVADRVIVLPPVPTAELLKWTASADVVHSLIEDTCLSYYLAAPNKLYEAAMAGIPVIASRYPEMEAVLTRHPYGILVNPESTQEIATALLTLYEDKSLRQKYRQVALEASRTELNWEKESEKLKNNILNVLASC